MSELAFTLLADGPSDRALLPILDWLLRQHSREALTPQFADRPRFVQFQQFAGKKPLHPLQILARAYRGDGFGPEGGKQG